MFPVSQIQQLEAPFNFRNDNYNNVVLQFQLFRVITDLLLFHFYCSDSMFLVVKVYPHLEKSYKNSSSWRLGQLVLKDISRHNRGCDIIEGRKLK